MELRQELPANPHRVHLSPGTITAIETEIRDAYHHFGERVETGGLLLGLYRTQLVPPRSLVVGATGPGPAAEHSRNSLTMAAQRIMDEQPVHLLELGQWHTHPSGTGIPSTPDLECWRQFREDTRAIAYVSVIATPHEDIGWMSPQFTAWVTGREYQGPHFCQRAVIVEP